VHERRPRLLCDDSGELRLYDGHDPGGLRLLRLHEQYASLLQLLSQPFTATQCKASVVSAIVIKAAYSSCMSTRPSSFFDIFSVTSSIRSAAVDRFRIGAVARPVLGIRPHVD
jgi:hypothetical protein